MYNTTSDLQTFYDDHVRLGRERREELGGFRDTNLDRVNDGLDDLAEESGCPHPHPYDFRNQGGYAMHTLNQAADNDYDIDVALLFKKDDLPTDPLAARQRICEALLKRCGNFSKDPEVRTNAVTVWYEEGYHVDFVIYRTWTDFWGTEYMEHASSEWKRRDPMAITNWFTKQVDEKSPKAGLFSQPKVADGQMRRIVRFLKWFCRSRTSWCLPGGMVVSTLVAECYRSDSDRDDRALYNTLVAVRDRLNSSTCIYNPVDGSQELTGKQEILKQVERLHKNLDRVIPKLAVLFDSGCTYDKARSAWDWVFNHTFWTTKEAIQKSVDSERFPNCVGLRCGLARQTRGTTYKDYRSGAFVLPKGVALKFTIASTNVKPPYTVHWKAQNEGDEAVDAGDEMWEKTGDVCWTSTKYKGTQKMICTIEKNDSIVAKSSHIVKISGDGWNSTL